MTGLQRLVRVRRTVLFVYLFALFALVVPAKATSPAGLKVQYRTHVTWPENDQIHALFRIINNGSLSVPLSSLTMRYWYTADGDRPQVFECDYAQVGCDHLGAKFVGLPVPRREADRYLEIGFTAAGNLVPGQSTGEIQLRVHKDDWSNFLQTNDYSMDLDQHFVFEDWLKVTLYRNGVLVWGIEP